MNIVIRTLAVSGTLLATALAQADGTASFYTVGGTAYDIAADGTVAGVSGSSNFTWTVAGGLNTSMGGIAPGSLATSGWVQISADGGKLLANGLNASTGKYEPAVYSTATGTWTLLGSNGGFSGSNTGSAYDMTPDGRYVAGASYAGTAGSSFHATIWDTTTGTHTDISGGTQSRLSGVSDNGSVAVGYLTSSQTSGIWIRQADGSYSKSAIIRPDGTTSLSITGAVSGNGLWAAGASFSTALPYYYNVSTGVATYFDKLSFDNGAGKSVASPTAISNDGQTIVGTHSILGTLDTNHGFIWNASFGVMELDSYFASYGVDTANAYNFVSPLAMKTLADGSTAFLGIAKNNSTNAMSGFVVTIPSAVPEPASFAMLASGLAVVGLIQRRRRYRAA